MTSPAHPYDPATVTADRRPSDDHPRHYRAAIIATYHGPGARGATWRATLRRSPNDRPASATVPAQDGPDAAVAALLRKLGLSWRMLPAAGSADGGGRYVYVAELTPGEGQALAAGPRAVWALAAAAELESATAGGEPPDLALMMARVATGTDRPRPVVAGWRYTGRLDGVALTDILGEPIPGLSYGGHLSPAGVLAAAQAAGWLLTAPMRATAHRLADVIGTDPDPAAVAQALAALGGCPAVVATLKGQAVAQ